MVTQVDSLKLDSRLKVDTFLVQELKLSTLLLMNDARYPWLILVPRVLSSSGDFVSEVFNLAEDQLLELHREIKLCAQFLKAEYKPVKINVANLGNLVRQLHVHIVARHEDDYAWPGPVWGKGKGMPYETKLLDNFIDKLQNYLLEP